VRRCWSRVLLQRCARCSGGGDEAGKRLRSGWKAAHADPSRCSCRWHRRRCWAGRAAHVTAARGAGPAGSRAARAAAAATAAHRVRSRACLPPITLSSCSPTLAAPSRRTRRTSGASQLRSACLRRVSISCSCLRPGTPVKEAARRL
jgi:hypothetical protein